VSQVWIDPDRPEDLCDLHPLWSATRWAPARFRGVDYGDGSGRSLADGARTALAPILGYEPTGPVRLLTQLRRWGWLFNPISVYVVWHDDPDRPVGVVAEVTNTPWKERHSYPLALGRADGAFVTEFDKQLHVSPFLDAGFRYHLRLADRDDRVALDLDLYRPGAVDPVLRTALRTRRVTPTRRALWSTLWRRPLSTYLVTARIHAQAARLARRRVPFVKHPKKSHGDSR
jgi:DUF1365 family protein